MRDLLPKDFAVFTADGELNKLGCGDPSRARILFSTHAMVLSRCKHRDFANVSELHYLGRPREVRLWDEAILPGDTLTVSRDIIGSLIERLRMSYPKLTAVLDDLFSTTLREAADGDTVELPDVEVFGGVSINDVLRLIEDWSADKISAVSTLWLLFGKTVTVRRDAPSEYIGGKRGQTLLDYRDTLPDDIKPLLVLDASARVRTVYKFWEDRRGGLERLPAAPKHYDKLTIHVWSQSGGKSAFRKYGAELTDAVTKTVNTKPDEEWLIVYHKNLGKNAVDVPEAVRASLTGDHSRVHFLNWGAHDATNEYKHVRNVILAGTLFYPTSRNESLGRLASGHPSSKGSFSETDLHDVVLGEHRHLILQALCRGDVRRCEGDQCPKTDAYIIASSRSGIKQSLPGIFPGASVKRWRPVKKELTGKMAQAVAYITGKLPEGSTGTVTFREVMKHLGVKDASNFRTDIRRNEDFRDAMAENDIEEYGKGKYQTCFRRISFANYAPDDAV